MLAILQRLLNEIPTILVAVWATLNAFGVVVSEEDRNMVASTVESLGTLAIWFLIRRNTDGPITALKNRYAPGTPQEVHD